MVYASAGLVARVGNRAQWRLAYDTSSRIPTSYTCLHYMDSKTIERTIQAKQSQKHIDEEIFRIVNA